MPTEAINNAATQATSFGKSALNTAWNIVSSKTTWVIAGLAFAGCLAAAPPETIGTAIKAMKPATSMTEVFGNTASVAKVAITEGAKPLGTNALAAFKWGADGTGKALNTVLSPT